MPPADDKVRAFQIQVQLIGTGIARAVDETLTESGLDDWDYVLIIRGGSAPERVIAVCSNASEHVAEELAQKWIDIRQKGKS